MSSLKRNALSYTTVACAALGKSSILSYKKKQWLTHTQRNNPSKITPSLR